MTEKQTPDLKTEVWPVDRVRPSPSNTKFHPPAQVEKLADSIREFGWTTPLLVAADGDLIAGHGRLQAAAHLGLEKVPVVIVSGLSDSEVRALRIADNRMGELGRWDSKNLASEVAGLMEADFDLGLLAFTDLQFAKMLDDPDLDPGEDNAPPLAESAVTELGDVWVMGEHRLVCGDSTDPANAALAAGGRKPTLMVTDPPYGVDYDPSFRLVLGKCATGKVSNDGFADWRQVWQNFDGAAAYVWHASRTAPEVIESLEAANLRVEAQIVWRKNRGIIGRGHYHQQAEHCVFAVAPRRKQVWNAGTAQGTVWRIPHLWQGENSFHGTQKPVECMRRPIRHASNPGDAIFEPFMGSGSTLIACELTERICAGIELDPLYVDVAVRRWQERTGREAVHESTGQTFSRREKALTTPRKSRKRKGDGDGKAGGKR